MGKYVIAKGYYGMGGNLVTLACAMRLAKKLDRNILVDWIDSCYGLSDADIFRVLFQSPEYSLGRDALANSVVWPDFWKSYILRTMPHSPQHALSRVTTDMIEEVDQADVSGADVIVVSRDDKYWYDPACRLEFSNIVGEIIPSDDVLREVREFQEQVLGPSPIGVHFRHGNGERSVVPPDIHWFFARVDEYLIESPDSQVFLCTDCSAILERFEENYPGKVVSTVKEYPPVGSGAMHQLKGDRQRLISAKEAVVDIWLLAKCKYLVSSRSFFSGFAAKLNKNLAGRYVKGWVPVHRQYNIQPGHIPVVEDPDLRPRLACNDIRTDGLYVEKDDQGLYKLYYLYSELGCYSSYDEVDFDRLKRQVVDIRSY